MPLGGLFGTAAGGQKQPLGKESSREGGGGNGDRKKDRKEGADKDAKGTVVKLSKGSVTIERKLAEGGFAIVYLATDHQNRQFALKRQFISDDLKQVEACTREYKIISELRGHKNIVCYVDHLLAQNKTGIWEYMLLTVYYKSSVLQLMNDRLSGGKGLSSREVLAIFCDMCEAVARLHHSNCPIIHRDLKVENILIDERNRAAAPVYVLCDFGSATTKILSLETHGARYIQDEIERYTTLSYRAPEMVDIYGGRPIGLKVDTWALGVMLYKLCYFSLPFGESAMAIQNGSFSFPAQPQYPDSIKAIIKCLLEADIDRRPSIYVCAQLAFQAAQIRCPIKNTHNLQTPKLSHVIDAFKQGLPINASKIKESSETVTEETPSDSCLIISERETEPSSSQISTSVAPRLRPKPVNSVPAVPLVIQSPKLFRPTPISTDNSRSEPEIVHANSCTVRDEPTDATAMDSCASEAPLSCPLFKPSDLGFTDLEETTNEREMERKRSQTDAAVMKRQEQQGQANVSSKLSTLSAKPISTSARSLQSDESASRVSHNGDLSHLQQHRRNASDTSQLAKSAFKPYSQTASVFSNRVPPPATTTSNFTSASIANNQGAVWNPFENAPFPNSGNSNTFGAPDEDVDSDSFSIDSRDPFGAAPFDLPTSAAETKRVSPSEVTHGEQKANDGVEKNKDSKLLQVEEDSELDEQRMSARGDYSYENIDGVGDDASTDSRDSRVRTDQDESTDDLSRNEEEEDAQSSQHTDVTANEDAVGSRPLLDDDGLEDDYDLLQSYDFVESSTAASVSAHPPTVPFSQPLYVDASRPLPRQLPSTNPFLASSTAAAATDCTPNISPNKLIEPELKHIHTIEIGDWREECTEASSQRSILHEKACLPLNPPLDSSYAPATLPRQSTPLVAAPRLSAAGIHHHHPEQPHKTEVTVQHEEPVIGTLIQVAPSLPAQPPVIKSCQPVALPLQTSVRPITTHPAPVLTKHAPISLPLPLATSNPVVSSKPLSTQLPPKEYSAIKQTIERPAVEESHPVASSLLSKQTAPKFVEGPKTPKPSKKSNKSNKEKKNKKEMRSSGSELETDGSEAEIFAGTSSDKGSASKKKKKSSGFSLRGVGGASSTAMGPGDRALAAAQADASKISAVNKKGKRSSVPNSKKGSGSAAQASFVNSSFQAEDLVESPPTRRGLRL